MIKQAGVGRLIRLVREPVEERQRLAGVWSCHPLVVAVRRRANVLRAEPEERGIDVPQPLVLRSILNRQQMRLNSIQSVLGLGRLGQGILESKGADELRVDVAGDGVLVYRTQRSAKKEHDAQCGITSAFTNFVRAHRLRWGTGRRARDSVVV